MRFLLLGLLLVFAGCGSPAGEDAVPPRIPTADFTATPTLVPATGSQLYLIGLPHDFPDLPPTPSPTPEATATARPQPPAPAPLQAASTSNGIPWFVPAAWHERYLACLVSPDRHTAQHWVWAYSIEGGRPDGWHYDQAMYVVAHEGGDDLCQFNTQGSGACGPFQTLSCAGLTPEEHYAAAFAKYRDGFRRNPYDPWRAHWFAFW